MNTFETVDHAMSVLDNLRLPERDLNPPDEHEIVPVFRALKPEGKTLFLREFIRQKPFAAMNVLADEMARTDNARKVLSAFMDGDYTEIGRIVAKAMEVGAEDAIDEQIAQEGA